MVLNTSARDHAARRNNDAWESAIIDLLRLLRRLGEGKALPLKRRTVVRDQLPGCVAVLFVVLQKYLDRFNGHRAVTKDRHAGALAGLHQLFHHEEEFLRTLHG